MNNSKLVLDSIEKVDTTPLMRERETHLVHVIEALQGVAQSQAWSTLKTELFDGLVKTLKGELYSEAKREVPDTLKLRHISGQLKWAEKFSDLSKLEATFRVELQGVRQNLHGKE